jgi:hypothetical protein
MHVKHVESRCRIPSMLECTEEDVRAALHDFTVAAVTMFGCNAEAAQIGITGQIELVELDGPVVLVSLRGAFWHRRETVLQNARAFLMQKIPELAEVDIFDASDLLDQIFDEETGALIEERRAPDWNGDREALEYQGIDPDVRGPFPEPSGGFRPGGSMLS